jgi:UDP-2,4-diacetamido-2,4,6-trideoxy-beta-L-altropyranose hydrolase
MQKPVALFRFHASHWRGAGHAIRCLTIAKALQKQGWKCEFVTEEETYDFIPSLKSYKRHDPDQFYAYPFLHDLLIVDHYDCGYEYEHHFRPFNKAIMVVDDLANRKHDCDIILDQAYGRTVIDYENDVPNGCDILTGPPYALMREEFINHRMESLERRKSIKKIERIFVNFGGNDQKNMILDTIKKLSEICYSGAIDVVFGVIAQHRESVESFAKTMPNAITFHINPDMASLMTKADFAVGAPGVSAWERFCLGLPTVLIPTAENQNFTYQALLKDGLALGGTIDSLSQKRLLVDFDTNFYHQCVQSCSTQTDGQGIHKIITLIRSRLDGKNSLRQKVS